MPVCKNESKFHNTRLVDIQIWIPFYELTRQEKETFKFDSSLVVRKIIQKCGESNSVFYTGLYYRLGSLSIGRRRFKSLATQFTKTKYAELSVKFLQRFSHNFLAIQIMFATRNFFLFFSAQMKS